MDVLTIGIQFDKGIEHCLKISVQ